MAERGGLMSSAEASRQLGVSMRQVQRLTASGALSQSGNVGRSHLIDAQSVHRLKVRGAGRGRPWEPETIAAAIELLNDGETARLTSVAHGRLRHRLSGMSADQFVRATRMRADVRGYRASVSFLEQAKAAVILTGSAAIDSDVALARKFGLGGSNRDIVDGYVDAKSARRLVRECHLAEDDEGNVTLRVTTIDALLRTCAVVVALDLAESLDTRDRSAGLAYLERQLRSLA
jgi:hypothetical protein